MGYYLERTTKAGAVRYTAIYRDVRGRLRSAGTYSTSKQADKAWQRAEAELAAGKIGDPQRGRRKLERYVEEEWFPNHVIEDSTRENYRYVLDKYLLPELGTMRMAEILPSHIREWITTLQTKYGARPPTIVKCKIVLDAIFTTALHDQITFLHPGKGVRTPPVATRPRRIITADQFARIHKSLPDNAIRLLVETDIESGLRWGELTELRVKDLDLDTAVLTVSRAVVQLTARSRPDGVRFVVKEYPKDREWRQLRLASHLVEKLHEHILAAGLGPDDLLFRMPSQDGPRRRTRPASLPDPDTLGVTEPNDQGRRYRHGTASAYGAGRCRCQHCRNAVAAYRASRRATGKDKPQSPRTVDTDGHIGRDWFRNAVWLKALADSGIGVHVTPHGLRHAHASWLLAGGANLQVVKERLGHASITTTEKYLRALPGADQAALAALAAIRGNGVPPAEGESTSSDERDAELAELRQKVARFKEFYESFDR
jgi:integrase